MPKERLVITDVTVVPGNGCARTEKGSISLYRGLIEEVGTRGAELGGGGPVRVIDGRGKIAIPGIINMHAHDVSFGPRQSGERPYSSNLVILQLYRHLLYGTTTILSVDGFQLPREARATMNHAPLKIKTCTLHTPRNFEMAKLRPQRYALSSDHESLTAEQAIGDGAVAIGQVGLGLALAMMWYDLIPREIERVTKRVLSPPEVRRLFESIVGLQIDKDVFDKSQVEKVLQDLELQTVLTAEHAREIIHGIVLPVYEGTIDSVRESADIARQLGVPVLVSNNSATQRVLREISEQLGDQLIALHSNHPSFKVDEAREQARSLRANGSYVDIMTGDFLGARRLFPSDEVTRALLSEGLVDLISTDYAGGYYEPILRLIEWAVQEQLITLEKAVMLCTAKPAQAIPKLAPNCGEIAPGRVADLTLVREERISDVFAVIKDGEVVVGPLGC